VTVAEAEVIVEPGRLDPNHIVTPGVFVQRLVQASDRIKDIEQRTVRPRADASAATEAAGTTSAVAV
ncbi:MAG: succinyl-CoA--3-ketoacid-CoA transferase, partial [Hyphomicrobiales bacterium]|nr:succinyl-CoA--3-ketoacid-CoA transferase [Hyphomicrobiales bacterium]